MNLMRASSFFSSISIFKAVDMNSGSEYGNVGNTRGENDHKINSL